jgi:uncharacterized tellurite resistance protein B-like protein
MDRTEQNRLTFVKSLVGVAWLDESVTAETLNCLKTYIRRLNQSEEESSAMKSYYTRTIREGEATELVESYLRLQQTLAPMDRDSLYRASVDLVELEDTDETDTEFLERIPSLFGGLHDVEDYISKCREVMKGGGIVEPPPSETRSDSLNDFVRSRIMHSVRSKMLDMKLVGDHLSAREVAYITSLSALLGRIAHADDDFSQEEKVEITILLKETTDMEHEDIDVVMQTIEDETLTGIDLKSITRTFYNLSDEPQRLQLLNSLFLVAGSDGHIDPEEVDEIERIAVGLNMTHRDILRAKANAMEIVRKRLSLQSGSY